MAEIGAIADRHFVKGELPMHRRGRASMATVV
jgi:hypothetical protein